MALPAHSHRPPPAAAGEGSTPERADRRGEEAGTAAAEGLPDGLSAREVEVLRLIALGHTSVEVARTLHLSPRTIETHRARINRKLGLHKRAELVRYALRRGLLGV